MILPSVRSDVLPFAWSDVMKLSKNHWLCGVEETGRFLTACICAGCLCAGGAGEARAQDPVVTPIDVERACSINGVLFSMDGDPIAGARVLIGDREFATNEDGGFHALLPPGEYEILVALGEDWSAPVRVTSVDLSKCGSAEIVISSRGPSRPPDFALEDGGHADVTAEKSDKPTEREDLGPPGKIKGRVEVFEEGAPIEGARVFVRGLDVEAKTDKQGRFELEVPPGKHDLALIHPEYSSRAEPGIEVMSEQAVEILVEMSPAAVTLDAFVVYVPRIEGSTASLLEERKDAVTMNEVIGAEQFSRSGDSSAAGALKRVTGLTVVGGKYVYVRGLGDRYSSTLLNGSTLPSPEPDKRVVPLDLFPTALLESVTIQKTYSPDMPGEFGGGVVRLQTRSFPREFEASTSLSLGLVGGTTFREIQTFQGGKFDFLGIDDGTRALPPEVEEAGADRQISLKNPTNERGYTQEELEEFGESMPRTWGLESGRALPNIGLGGTVGNTFDLGGVKLGARGSLTYSNNWDIQQETRRYVRYDSATDELDVRDEFDFETINNQVIVGGIFAGGVEFNRNQKIRVTSMINRVTDDVSRVYTGFNRDAQTDIQVRRGRWLERQLLFEQITGEHRLAPKLELDWRYVYSRASMVEPDRRETRYDYEPEAGQFLFSAYAENNSRLYSELQDNNHDAAFDLTYRLGANDSEEGDQEEEKRGVSFSAGAQAVSKERDVDTRRYKFQDLSISDELRALPADELFVPENIGPGQAFRFEEITRPTDSYEASQQVFGGYLASEVPLGARLTLTGGVRVEYSSQEVASFEPFAPDKEPIRANVESADLLPALNVSFDLDERMKLRGAISRTVSRPDFRELSPACFNDVVGGQQVCGNPEDLDRARIVHADGRWEYYPDVGESLSASVFYKYFDSPIEEILIPGAVNTLTFANARSATLMGIELETRKSLGFATERMEDFYVSGNVSLIRSRVTLDPELDLSLTSLERSLQGQSPYVINVQFGWEPEALGIDATVLYNVFGPRIASVGVQGVPDTYEMPFHQLDAVVSYRISDQFRLGFKAKNLLDLASISRTGDIDTRREIRGREVSLSVGAKF